MGVAMPQERKPPQPNTTLRDLLDCALVVLYLLFMPVTFPVTVLYHRVNKRRLYGKGAAVAFMLWVFTSALWLLALAIYLRRR